jgi:NAD(P)-dependent dehydrogenase (short-subunit alcohol dehydrogenase family)
MAKFDGKIAVVTGGSSGIGFVAARELTREGARVVITGRSRDALERAAKELGPRAFPVVADASKVADLEPLVAKVKELGPLDFLFFNAGVAGFVPFEDVTEKFYDEMTSINTKGAFFTVQKLVPLMRAGSSIVFNTSVVNVKGLENSSTYSATKAALRSLTRTLATELLSKNIRVNAVSPGPITTPIFTKMGIPAEALDGIAAEFRAQNPMKRFGEPIEVAQAALFLGFDASYTTGAELPVDGGFSQL